MILNSRLTHLDIHLLYERVIPKCLRGNFAPKLAKMRSVPAHKDLVGLEGMRLRYRYGHIRKHRRLTRKNYALANIILRQQRRQLALILAIIDIHPALTAITVAPANTANIQTGLAGGIEQRLTFGHIYSQAAWLKKNFAGLFLILHKDRLQCFINSN